MSENYNQDIKHYLAVGDNMNAKNLYFYCKKLGKPYPFVRAAFKALLPDHKLVILPRGEGTRYGMFSVESSVGFAVPGIVFEVIDNVDLSIFSNEFEAVEVADFSTGALVSVLVNKRESGNTVPISRVNRVKISKERRKLLKKAIKWRNLDEFESCFDSAISHVNYPHMIKNLFLSDAQVLFLSNHDIKIDINEYNSFKVSETEFQKAGKMVRVIHTRVAQILNLLDSRMDEMTQWKRSILEIMNEDDGPMYVWCYV